MKEAQALLEEMQPNWLAMRLNQGELDGLSLSEIEVAGDQILEKVYILEAV